MPAFIIIIMKIKQTAKTTTKLTTDTMSVHQNALPNIVMMAKEQCLALYFAYISVDRKAMRSALEVSLM